MNKIWALNKIEVVSLQMKGRMGLGKAKYGICHEHEPAIQRKEGGRQAEGRKEGS